MKPVVAGWFAIIAASGLEVWQYNVSLTDAVKVGTVAGWLVASFIGMMMTRAYIKTQGRRKPLPSFFSAYVMAVTVGIGVGLAIAQTDSIGAEYKALSVMVAASIAEYVISALLTIARDLAKYPIEFILRIYRLYRTGAEIERTGSTGKFTRDEFGFPEIKGDERADKDETDGGEDSAKFPRRRRNPTEH